LSGSSKTFKEFLVKDRYWCDDCHGVRTYHLAKRPTIALINGEEKEYTVTACICDTCYAQMHPPGLFEHNMDEITEAWETEKLHKRNERIRSKNTRGSYPKTGKAAFENDTEKQTRQRTKRSDYRAALDALDRANKVQPIQDVQEAQVISLKQKAR